MKLIFRNSQGIERVIAFVDTEEEAMKEIHKFCNNRNFKIYYTRTWVKDNRKWFDVGSHTEFFIIEYDKS